MDGVVFGAKYLGSTQLKSEKNPATNARMAQAQEAVDRIKVKPQDTLSMALNIFNFTVVCCVLDHASVA